MSPETHCGFAEETCGDVAWSDAAFVRQVEPHEACNLRSVYALLFLGWVVPLLIAGASCLVVGNIIKVPQDSAWKGACNAVLAVCGPLALAMLLFHGHLLKRIVVGRIGRRAERLFDPASPCALVEIENAATFDKAKLLPDDIGLLHARDGVLELEMEKHRARFPAAEVAFRLNVQQGAPTTAVGVTLAYKGAEPAWTVTLTPFSQTANLLQPAFPRSRATWLLQWISQDLAGER